MRKTLQQRGDTIVEVLIAIAVLSSVLGIAYSVMNRNVQTIRDNQERTEASKIAQTQVEAIKQAWNTRNSAFLNQIDVSGPTTFCMDGASVIDMGGGDNVQPNLDLDDPASYPDECKNPDGAFYRWAVVYDDASLRRFRIYVRWERLGGNNATQPHSEVITVYGLE